MNSNESGSASHPFSFVFNCETKEEEEEEVADVGRANGASSPIDLTWRSSSNGPPSFNQSLILKFNSFLCLVSTVFLYFILEEPKSSAMLSLASTRPAPFYPESVAPPPATATSSDMSSSSSGGSSSTCLHNGNVYRHKERFTSTSIGLKPEHPNQCVQCACEVSGRQMIDFIFRNSSTE